jgi:RNA polymerase sigma-70 factor (ECF subfamily)
MLSPSELFALERTTLMESLEPPTDEEIVEQVLSGDGSAFELILRRYNQRLFRVARGILGDDAEAEDVLQEAYVRAFAHLDQFEGRSKFSTWLTRIAVHEATARRRRRRRMRLVDLGNEEGLCMPPISHNPEAEASRVELGALLRELIDMLPSSLRAVVMLRLVEGLDTDEAAECLGLTSANVKIRLHRARSLLREQIDERIGEEARQLYQFDGQRCDRIVQAVMSRVSQPPHAS